MKSKTPPIASRPPSNLPQTRKPSTLARAWPIALLASVILGSAATAGTTVALEGCVIKSCTAMGCIDAFVASGNVTLSVGIHQVTVCFDAVCGQGTLEVREHDPGHCELLQGPPITGDICIGSEIPTTLVGVRLDRELKISFDFRFSQGVEDVAVRVVAPDGSTILDAKSPVQRGQFYPNGPDCDPGCKAAKVQF